MDYGRFTDVALLRSIGRDLLDKFLEQFVADLAEKGMSPPDKEIDDTDYYTAVGTFLLGDEEMPGRMHEALHAIHGMATPEGRALLVGEVAARLSDATQIGNMTNEEVAMRAWMAAPDVVAQRFSESRLVRLSRFDVLERGKNPFTWAPQSAGSVRKDDVLLNSLDAWFEGNGRGTQTVQVMRHELNGEEWFVVRHGDTFTRATKVERRKFEVLHYRPAKDDVVVYSAATEQLRINARTKGEAEEYRRAFGLYLKGYENYFQVTAQFTLEPIRALGEAALACEDVPGLERVTLTSLQVELQNGYNQGYTLHADDLFACSWSPGRTGLVIPEGARIVRGAFELHVQGMEKPIELHIIPPNRLRLARAAALAVVNDFMVRRRFKLGDGLTVIEEVANEHLVAMP